MPEMSRGAVVGAGEEIVGSGVVPPPPRKRRTPFMLIEFEA